MANSRGMRIGPQPLPRRSRPLLKPLRGPYVARARPPSCKGSAVKAVLFISYDGMTDPLGQSQVIPYLRGLAAKGHRITILSCEKPKLLAALEGRVGTTLSEAGIAWHSVPYTKRPAALSTAWDLARMYREGVRLARETPFDIVHCRSILATLVGRRLRDRFGMKLIFDTRGFWADERVDGGLWRLNRPIDAALYNTARRLEGRGYESADLLFTLTKKAAAVIRERVVGRFVRIETVPCCVDMGRFDPRRFGDHERRAVYQRLGVTPDTFVLAYVGSLGTRYLLQPMMEFFSHVRARRADAVFLILSPSSPRIVGEAAAASGVPPESLRVLSVGHDEVPVHLAAAQASVFFIRNGRSDAAVSPTKQGEAMAMGLTPVCNAGLGDSDEIVGDSGAGIVLQALDRDSLANAAERLFSPQRLSPAEVRRIAARYLSLDMGIERYHRAWESLR